MDADKASARMRLRELLRATAPEQRAAWSARLRSHLMASEMWRAADTVMLFAALRHEPDLLPLLQTGKRFVFPSLEEDRIVAREVAGLEELALSPMGIREPDPQKCPVVANPGLVLVPGLGFGLDGSRLGRGGGHYDRFLAGLPAKPPRCGVCFSCQLSPTLPRERHDVMMDAVLTETGISPALR